MSGRIDASRRSWNSGWTLVTCAALTVLGGRLAAQSEAAPRLNLVFLLIDDMGWPDLGCYGNRFNETPHIDRLAAQGMTFTDFYATPVCSSTRSTIQSGQNSARTGITDFIPGHWRPFEKLIVPPIDHHLQGGVKTPGDALKAAGYVTGYFGKWHLGNENTHGPEHHGYDVTARTLGQEFRQGREGRPDGPKRIDLLTDQTIAFIEENRDRRFFVTLSHHAVHIPLEATPGTIEKYRRKLKPDERVNNPVYAAMTENLDDSVGRIVTKIDELGLSERTVIVFASDNGGLRKIYTGIGEVVSSNAPLRDEKGTLYEGGIRVPLIVRWPGVVKPGTICREPATTADLLPTFCGIVGAKLPEQPIDGASLVALLKKPEARLDRDAIFFHYPHYHHSRPAGAVRNGDWKLIEFFDDKTLELYNLRSDLGETRNVAELEPERTRDLRSRLHEWQRSVEARMPSVNPKYDPERAHEWWNRSTNQPLDLEAMARRYRSRTSGTGQSVEKQ